jgi:hypothetical protein
MGFHEKPKRRVTPLDAGVSGSKGCAKLHARVLGFFVFIRKI